MLPEYQMRSVTRGMIVCSMIKEQEQKQQQMKIYSHLFGIRSKSQSFQAHHSNSHESYTYFLLYVCLCHWCYCWYFAGRTEKKMRVWFWPNFHEMNNKTLYTLYSIKLLFSMSAVLFCWLLSEFNLRFQTRDKSITKWGFLWWTKNY